MGKNRDIEISTYKNLTTTLQKQQFMRELLESLDDSFPYKHSEEWNKIVKILMDEQEIHNEMLNEYTQTNEFPLTGYLRWVYGVNIAPKQLNKAIETKNGKLLGEIFYGLEEKYLPNYLENMNLLLLEDWHTYHYDIVLELQRLKNPKSIEPLYLYVTQNRESNLAYKIVWALADIGTKEAKEKILALLKYVDDVQVKVLISKRLQLWESERWRKELKPLPEGWYLTNEEDDSYTKELYVELAEGHELYGQPLRVVMCDGLHQEVMCQHLDKEDYHSMVHLTWSGREEFEGCPTYSSGYTWEECCKG